MPERFSSQGFNQVFFPGNLQGIYPWIPLGIFILGFLYGFLHVLDLEFHKATGVYPRTSPGILQNFALEIFSGTLPGKKSQDILPEIPPRIYSRIPRDLFIDFPGILSLNSVGIPSRNFSRDSSGNIFRNSSSNLSWDPSKEPPGNLRREFLKGFL